MLQVKKKLFLLHEYMMYRLRAKTTHGTHSPFVFDMLNKAIYSPHSFYAYNKIEAYRRRLLTSTERIHCTDLGAGAIGEEGHNWKHVNAIAKKAVKSAKYGQLLFRLVNYFQPKTILELGTSLGVTTCYLSAANSESHVITIEGCHETAAIARENWSRLGYKNISPRIGNFDELLPETLKDIQTLDFVFFDGNHRKQPTLDYFNKCLEKSHEKSIFVMDDIYWSEEMKEAWEVIKADPRVTITIDLFFVGLVFFRKGQAKQDFVIKF
jgi:predicted O-methyltransferase YrrM